MYDPAHLSFRPVTWEALPQLYLWSQEPHVRRWWDPPASYEKFLDAIETLLRGENPRQPFLILFAGRPIGYIHVFRIREVSPYRRAYAVDEEAAGIDLYIGDPAYLHRGLGPHILQRFLEERVFTDSTLSSCIIGPEPENIAAIRAYQKAGFRYLKTVEIPELGERQYLMRLPRTKGGSTE